MAQVTANREDDIGQQRIFGPHFAIKMATLDDPAGRGKIDADVLCVEGQPDTEFLSSKMQHCCANKGSNCQEDAYYQEKNLLPKYQQSCATRFCGHSRILLPTKKIAFFEFPLKG